MNKILLAAALLAAIGMSGCAEVTETMNGAGRSVDSFFSGG